MIYYAKTKPIETIREHTDNVLKECKNLKGVYEIEINNIIKNFIEPEYFWKLLEFCCEYHDYGKCNVQFQNKLRKKIREMKEVEQKSGDFNEIPCDEHEEIPHNYLSPAFLPIEKLREINDERLRNSIYQAIAYHHERKSIPDPSEIKEYIKDTLNKELDGINKHMENGVNKVFAGYAAKIENIRRIKDKDENYRFYIMLKGMLHRLDHSASAHVDVEEKLKKTVGECTEDFFNKNHWDLREPQKFAMEHREDNLLITASTGIGKTESALLWIDDKKSFFTLPLRVSLNALYSRVKDDIGYNSVGLLHSSALEYMEKQEDEEAYKTYEEASLLSKKLSFSTIDQIFKYPFKYLGYEKVLATLAYSKVVIDEIQAYSPEIAAVILYAIKQLNDMGGKFMIMTATLPRIYKDKLKEFNINFKEEKFISDNDRHKIKLVDDEIINSIEKVLKFGRKNKVLIIVNTVDKAIEYYKALKDSGLNVNLLHSLFNNNDRSRKEEEIKQFTKNENKECGVWITTQIVEASLDVDFDYLISEMSTLDSQFQRYGRCFRKRIFQGIEPNIFIYTKNSSGIGSVYDEEIFNKSIELLIPYDNQILKEAVKVDLVDKLYSKELLKGTKFLKKFIEACNVLENIIPYENTSREAQQVLRDIDSVRVIPNEIYSSNINLFDEIIESKSEDRHKLFREINNLTISIPKQKLKKFTKLNKELRVDTIVNIDNILLINAKYTNEEGLCLGELYDNIF
ncbi:CRISPR-associated helicase Cas3 [Clostridium sp. DL-VIII]|uniref:CRISPR-associated helicase/endonuclease Cas3 n=1 Tax=Clostridium sp. DL-VIII TaxID=641107 RepID=UPI00023B0882|nr:CRISPR-associated helicase/endonuclease Cas3 [Clostridium sp. DL-VIII]EHJ01147.1 CRISPR-associated helicase Cas3 [Clostridium sp. DL-VIII]